MSGELSRSGVPLDAMANFSAIADRVRRSKQVFVFADFDGTLAPIVSVPSLAIMPADLRAVLRTISLQEQVTTAIISGRAIDDLRTRVGLPVICAGDHGLEIHGPDFEYAVPEAERLRSSLLAVCNTLRDRLAGVSGALVECKRLSASVHYRQVAREDLWRVSKEVELILGRFAEFHTREGKEVTEIRPRVAWTKGSAARWILHRCGGEESQVICIGDDNTDEDMFAELRSGINVRIGFEPSTAAGYWMAESDIPDFLCGILDVLRGKFAQGAANFGSPRAAGNHNQRQPMPRQQIVDSAP